MAVCNVFPVIDLLATGRSIEQRRKAAGLSVRDVQTYFGFEYPQAVYKWQHGECLPSVDNLLALSKLLQVPMEDLLVYEDQEVPLIFGEISVPNAKLRAVSGAELLSAAAVCFFVGDFPGDRGDGPDRAALAVQLPAGLAAHFLPGNELLHGASLLSGPVGGRFLKQHTTRPRKNH